MTVKVRNFESLPALRYLLFCNILHICNVRAIPIYRVYELYDIAIAIGYHTKYCSMINHYTIVSPTGAGRLAYLFVCMYSVYTKMCTCLEKLK